MSPIRMDLTIPVGHMSVQDLGKGITLYKHFVFGNRVDNHYYVTLGFDAILTPIDVLQEAVNL